MIISLDQTKDYLRLEYTDNEKERYFNLENIDEDYINRMIPSDKSITHRVLILSLLINKGAFVFNPLISLDTISTMKFLKKLGARIDFILDDVVFKDLEIDNDLIDKLSGYNRICLDIRSSRDKDTTKEDIKNKDHLIYLDCGCSGTCARLLMGAIIALEKEGLYCIDGSNSLRVRPMRRVVEILTKMGVDIENKDNLPILIKKIDTNDIKVLSYFLKISSAQLKSLIMFSYLNSTGSYSIELPSGSRKHTEDILEDLFLKNQSGSIHTSYKYDKDSDIRLERIEINQTKKISDFKKEEFYVPKDPSSIIFFIILFYLLGKTVSFKKLSNSLGRLSYVDILNTIGFNIKIYPKDKYSLDLVSLVEDDKKSIEDRFNGLTPITVRKDMISSIIDELPSLMILSGFIEGDSYFYGVDELRVKESDRLEGVLRFLDLFNIKLDIKESNRGVDVIVHGKGYKNVEHSKRDDFMYYDSFEDHRMVMIATVFSLIFKKNMIILNSECVKESFPRFWEILKEIVK